ncbi:hypothetical protein JCM10213_001375 [Rhodosporidiobolus nylandii]
MPGRSDYHRSVEEGGGVVPPRSTPATLLPIGAFDPSLNSSKWFHLYTGKTLNPIPQKLGSIKPKDVIAALEKPKVPVKNPPVVVIIDVRGTEYVKAKYAANAPYKFKGAFYVPSQGGTPTHAADVLARLQADPARWKRILHADAVIIHCHQAMDRSVGFFAQYAKRAYGGEAGFEAWNPARQMAIMEPGWQVFCDGALKGSFSKYGGVMTATLDPIV